MTIVSDDRGRQYKLGWFRLTKIDTKEYVRRKQLRMVFFSKQTDHIVVFNPCWDTSYLVEAGYVPMGFEIGCATFDFPNTAMIRKWATRYMMNDEIFWEA